MCIKLAFRLFFLTLALLVSVAVLGALDGINGMRENPLVQQAMLDLAKRESISSEEITLVSFEEVVWPDASMGCPHPDMRYRQVPQDGARIVLLARGERREYHSGGNRAPFLCQHSSGRKAAIPKSTDSI
jgi:hypothetical protein